MSIPIPRCCEGEAVDTLESAKALIAYLTESYPDALSETADEGRIIIGQIIGDLIAHAQQELKPPAPRGKRAP